MSRFKFEVDAEADTYCNEVVGTMVALFGISEAEALGRINRYWMGKRLIGPNCPIYHESPEYFAKTIWYGPNVAWWKGEEGLSGSQFP